MVGLTIDGLADSFSTELVKDKSEGIELYHHDQQMDSEWN